MQFLIVFFDKIRYYNLVNILFYLHKFFIYCLYFSLSRTITMQSIATYNFIAPYLTIIAYYQPVYMIKPKVAFLEGRLFSS